MKRLRNFIVRFIARTVVEDFRNNGITRQAVQSELAGTEVPRAVVSLGAMPAGEVLARAVSEKPDALKLGLLFKIRAPGKGRMNDE